MRLYSYHLPGHHHCPAYQRLCCSTLSIFLILCVSPDLPARLPSRVRYIPSQPFSKVTCAVHSCTFFPLKGSATTFSAVTPVVQVPVQPVRHRYYFAGNPIGASLPKRSIIYMCVFAPAYQSNYFNISYFWQVPIRYFYRCSVVRIVMQLERRKLFPEEFHL
jgi:hypothetical protein